LIIDLMSALRVRLLPEYVCQFQPGWKYIWRRVKNTYEFIWVDECRMFNVVFEQELATILESQ
jgi:hypothetical protein